MGNSRSHASGGCCCESGDAAEAVEQVRPTLESGSTAASYSMAEGVSSHQDDDLSKYFREWGSIAKALAGADVVLIRGSWVERVYRSGGALPRRQDLPKDAVWGAEELLHDMRDHRRPTPQLLAISYSWLTGEHPDPDGYHLRTFAPLLRHFARRRKIEVDSLALFIDWCSLPQSPRSEEETAAFKRALHSVDLWFAHWITEVWLLTRVPDGVTPFDARGWTSFEWAIAAMLTPAESILDLGRLREGWRSWGQVIQDCQARRRPPSLPDAFAAELLTKTFSVGEDREFVASKYREIFHQIMRSTEQLWFAGAGWGNHEIKKFTEILPLCGRLRELELHGNEISGDGAAVLARAISRCGSLDRLGLNANLLSQDAMGELRVAWITAGKLERGLEFGHQHVIASSQHAVMHDSSEFPDMDPVAIPHSLGSLGSTTYPGSDAGGSSDAATAEQFTSILARQAAFEARVDTGMQRLAHNLAEVASAMNTPRYGPEGGSAMNSSYDYARSPSFPPRAPSMMHTMGSSPTLTPRNWQQPPFSGSQSHAYHVGGGRHGNF